MTFSRPPEITSQAGAAIASLGVVENGKTVTDINASDPDSPAPTYAIAHGADATKFVINPTTGVLSFIEAPDFAPRRTRAPTMSTTWSCRRTTLRQFRRSGPPCRGDQCGRSGP